MTRKINNSLQIVFCISQAALFLKWFGFGQETLISGVNTLFINNWLCLVGIMLFEYGLYAKPQNVLWRAAGHVVVLLGAVYSMFTWYLKFVTPEFEFWLGIQTVQPGFGIYLFLTMSSFLLNIVIWRVQSI